MVNPVSQVLEYSGINPGAQFSLPVQGSSDRTLVADARGADRQGIPQPDPNAFKGVPLVRGQSRLLQPFRSFIHAGASEAHFDLVERRNAETGKYELVMISADPAGRKYPVMLVEGNRTAPARLEEFGYGQPLVEKMRVAFKALNASENRASAGQSGGFKPGNIWDAAVGGITSLVNVGAQLPVAVERLGRGIITLPRQLQATAEALFGDVTGHKPYEDGPSNIIKTERRTQFAKGSVVADGVQTLRTGIANLLGADPNTLAYSIGDVVAPFLVAARTASGSRAANSQGKALPRALDPNRVAAINGDIPKAPLSQVVDAVKRMTPEFIERLKTHPDTKGTFNALVARLKASAGTSSDANQQLQRLTGSVGGSSIVPVNTAGRPTVQRAPVPTGGVGDVNRAERPNSNQTTPDKLAANTKPGPRDIERQLQEYALNNPIKIDGNRTFWRPDSSTTVKDALTFNTKSSGGDQIAIPVQIIRNGPSGSTGISNEIWVGSPDQFRNFYDTLDAQGKLAGNPSFTSLLKQAGLERSFSGRVADSLSRRAATIEAADRTTLFGSSVGIQPTRDAAIGSVMSFNRSTQSNDLQIYVPLKRDVSGPGLPAGSYGVVHAIYQGPAQNLRGFFDEMSRQGRIPQGVTFDGLLKQSGTAKTYTERMASLKARGNGTDQRIITPEKTPRDIGATTRQPVVNDPAAGRRKVQGANPNGSGNSSEQRTELVNLASSNQTRDRLVNEAVRQQAVATGDEVVKTIDLFTNPHSPLTGDIQLKQMPVLDAYVNQFEGRPYSIFLADSSAGGRVAFPNFSSGFNEATGKQQWQTSISIWGDDLNAPYGNLSLSDLKLYTNDMFAVGRLLNPDCMAGVCNTFHAAIDTGLPAIEDPNAPPYVHLIKTTAKAMVEAAKLGDTKPVLLATPATVSSGIYTRAIDEASEGKLSLIQIPAPAFAPAVNNGDHLKPEGSRERIALDQAADEYVKLIPGDATSVWLCCTHYPALTETIHAALERAGKGNIKIVDPMRYQGYAVAEEYWTWKLSGGAQTPGQEEPFDPFMGTSAKQEDLIEIGRLGNVFVNQGDPTKPIVPIITVGDYGQVNFETLSSAINKLPGRKPLVDPSKLPGDTPLNNPQTPWDGPNPQTLQVIKNNEPPPWLVQFREKYGHLGGDPTLRVDPNPPNDGSGQAAPNEVWSDPMLQNLMPAQRQAVEDSYVKYREAGGTKSLRDFLIGTADDPGVVKLFDEQKYLRGKSPSIPEIAENLATEKVQQRGTNEPTQTTAGSGATPGVNSGGAGGRTDVKVIPDMQGVDPFAVNYVEELRNTIPGGMTIPDYEGAKMAARKAALTQEVRDVISQSLRDGRLDLGNGEFLYAHAGALYTQPEGRGDKILSISTPSGLNVGNRVEVDSNWMIENALGENRIPLAAKIWNIYAKTQIHGVPTYEIRAVISPNLPSYVDPKTLKGTDLWGNPITYKPFPHETDVPTPDLIYGRNLWELTKALEKDLVTPYEIRGFYTEQNIPTGKFGSDIGGPGPMVERGDFSGNLPTEMPDGKYDYRYVNVKNFVLEHWLKGLVDTGPLRTARNRYRTIDDYDKVATDYRAEATFDAGRIRFWLGLTAVSGTGVVLNVVNHLNGYTKGGIVGLLEDLRDDTAIIEKGGNDPTVGPRMAQKIRQFIPVAESTVKLGWNGWQTEINKLRDAARLYDDGKIVEANAQLSSAISDMESKSPAESYTFTGQITLFMAQTQRDTNEKYGGVSANGTLTAAAISAQGGVGADGKPLPSLQVTQKALQNQTLPQEVDSLYRAAIGNVSKQNDADVSTLKTDIDIINGAIDSISRLPPRLVSHPKTVEALASLRVLAVNKQGQIAALEQGSKNRGLQVLINNVNQELAELRLESDREFRKIAAEVPGAMLLEDGQVVAPEHEITKRETAEASARANLDDKVVENTRNQTLLREGAISQQLADKGTLELEQARQSHASALANLRAVKREDGTSVDLTKGRRLGLETIQEKMKELRQLQNQIR